MHHTTIKIIGSSELFQSLPSSLVNEMWGTCPFSFGDCTHSLVHPSWIRDWITDIFDDEENEQVNNFFKTLVTLSKDGVYVDLEN
jgi:hypothetical protein